MVTTLFVLGVLANKIILKEVKDITQKGKVNIISIADGCDFISERSKKIIEETTTKNMRI
jgi:hypothetical protein